MANPSDTPGESAVALISKKDAAIDRFQDHTFPQLPRVGLLIAYIACSSYATIGFSPALIRQMSLNLGCH